MRKVKIVILVVVIALTVLFVTQNQPYFQERHRFVFDPFVLEPITLPELPNLIYFCICLGLGGLITWLATVIGRFRLKKELKVLGQTTTSQQVKIDTLNRELAEAKAIPSSIETVASVPDVDHVEDASVPVEDVSVSDTDLAEENSIPASTDKV